MLTCPMNKHSSESRLEETSQVKQPRSFNRHIVRERKGQEGIYHVNKGSKLNYCAHLGDETIQ